MITKDSRYKKTHSGELYMLAISSNFCINTIYPNHRLYQNLIYHPFLETKRLSRNALPYHSTLPKDSLVAVVESESFFRRPIGS